MVHPVRRVFFVVAALCLIFAGTRADRLIADGCPCTIWPPTATPANAAVVAPTTDRWNLAVVEIVSP